jgi:transcriptional regulator with XRE-family HTH domain
VEGEGKMLSPFGKLCRKLRIDNGELLKDMAEKLGVTPSYLSAVEVGKRNVPKDWPKKISDIYSLNDQETKALENAAKVSQLKVRVDLDNVAESDKELFLAFARQFTTLTNTDKERIKAILSRTNR